MKLPLNKVIAFAGPYAAIVGGAVATWVLNHLHWLGDFHTHDEVGGWATQAIIFVVSAGLIWLGEQKWLSGWIEWEKTHPEEAKDDRAVPPTVP